MTDQPIPVGSRVELAAGYRERFGVRCGRVARYELVGTFAARVAARMGLTVAESLALYAPVVEQTWPVVCVDPGGLCPVPFELAIHPDELRVLNDVPIDAN